jgi:hypothetical protein
VTSSSSSSPREHLYRASGAIRSYLAQSHPDHLFFDHKYVAWAHEDKRNAELRIALDIMRIALDIIERNTTCGNVVTPRRP